MLRDPTHSCYGRRRPVRNWTSNRKPTKNCRPGSRGNHLILARRATAARSRWSALLHELGNAAKFVSCQLAQSHQETIRHPSNSSTRFEYLQKRVRLWTNADAHALWTRKSGSIRAWQQRDRSTPRLSTAADQEGKGSGS